MRPTGWISRFRRDRKGSAAVEFAFTLPILLILHIASQDVALAFAFGRKLDNGVSTAGDLVSQMTEINKAAVLEIFDANAAILQSYDATRLGIRISVVNLNKNGTPSVSWSLSPNTILKPRSKGSAIELPNDLRATDEVSVIVTEAVYSYPFQFGGYGLNGLVNLNADSYARTRGGKLPDCSDCF